MSDGFRSLVINTQERAVSTDINRLQKFAHQEIAELFRSMLDVYPASDDDQLGTITEPNTIETPLRAEILNGLMVQPTGGTTSVAISGGVAFFMAPDAAADESNYKFIRDPGLATGSLTIAANASGSTRIDVIECQINATPAIVTDSRDIFNTATGLFSAGTVTKETRGQLSYRVRAGTPGAGFPGTVSGWLPLAVVSVPNGATNVDTCTFWDVRPLVSDRTHLYSTPKDMSDTLRGDGMITYAAGVSTMTGHYEATYNGRRLGGKMRRGGIGTDGDLVLTDASNYAADVSFAANSMTYVYLMVPYGLPRWARYTDGPANRVPRSPRGIPVLSSIAPDVKGKPSAAITLPASLGFVTTTTAGVCIAADPCTIQDGATTRGPNQLWIAGRSQVFGGPRPGGVFAGHSIAGSTAGGKSTITFTPGTNFPANARRLYVSFAGNITSDNTSALDIVGAAIFNTSPATFATSIGRDLSILYLATTVGKTAYSFVWEGWIDVPYKYPSAAAAFDVIVSDGNLWLTSASVQIKGWEL